MKIIQTRYFNFIYTNRSLRKQLFNTNCMVYFDKMLNEKPKRIFFKLQVEETNHFHFDDQMRCKRYEKRCELFSIQVFIYFEMVFNVRVYVFVWNWIKASVGGRNKIRRNDSLGSEKINKSVSTSSTTIMIVKCSWKECIEFYFAQMFWNSYITGDMCMEAIWELLQLRFE